MRPKPSLFIDKRGRAVRFYLLLDQKLDKHNKIEPELRKKIQGHGGALVNNFREADYVLVDQCTPAGANFISMHTTSTRYVVAMEFIQESIDRHQLVPYSELKLFIEEDRPIVFCLHRSLHKADLDQLRKVIQLRGGDPSGEPNNSQVVICHTMSECNEWMEFKDTVCLGTPEWLLSCIECNRFTLHSLISEGNSSERPKQTVLKGPRNEFTKEDDQFLVAWIATHFGYSMAGRQGNRAYQDMVKSAEYKRWSSSHTWQSWREHYKNKKNQLDPLIEAYLVQNGTADMVCSLDEGVQVKHEEAQGWHEVQSSTVM